MESSIKHYIGVSCHYFVVIELVTKGIVEEKSEELSVIFSKAESLFMNHFSRGGSKLGFWDGDKMVDEDGKVIEGVGSYGGAKVAHNSKEFRDGVINYMRFLMKLLELDFYERSLSFKEKDLSVRRLQGKRRSF